MRQRAGTRMTSISGRLRRRRAPHWAVHTVAHASPTAAYFPRPVGAARRALQLLRRTLNSIGARVFVLPAQAMVRTQSHAHLRARARLSFRWSMPRWWVHQAGQGSSVLHRAATGVRCRVCSLVYAVVLDGTGRLGAVAVWPVALRYGVRLASSCTVQCCVIACSVWYGPVGVRAVQDRAINPLCAQHIARHLGSTQRRCAAGLKATVPRRSVCSGRVLTLRVHCSVHRARSRMVLETEAAAADFTSALSVCQRHLHAFRLSKRMLR